LHVGGGDFAVVFFDVFDDFGIGGKTLRKCQQGQGEDGCYVCFFVGGAGWCFSWFLFLLLVEKELVCFGD
jgi:hypothetical protein